MSDETKREVVQHLMFVIFFVIGLFSTDIFMSGDAADGPGGPENVANTSGSDPDQKAVPARSVARYVALSTHELSTNSGSPKIAIDPSSANWTDETDQTLVEKIALVRQLEQRRIRTIEKVRPAVVAVFGLERQGGGSGVLIHPSGLALTNHHVIAAAGVEGYGGLADGKLYRWKLIGNDPGGDLALIQLIPEQANDLFPFVALGDSDQVNVGDWTLVMGNPFTLAEDYQPTVTFGIVSGVKRYQPGMQDTLLVYGNCIQVDTSINPGNSGGPLFDIDGKLIGINGRASFDFKKRGRVNVGLGYAISVNQCRNFLPELMATKLIQHGTLDAVFQDRDGKVICSAIYEDAEIGNLGLSLGDELLEFETIQIESANQFTNLVCTLPAGWPAQLKIRKPDGSESEIRLRLVGLPYPKAEAPPVRIKENAPQDTPVPGPKKDAPQQNQGEPKPGTQPNAKDSVPKDTPLQEQIENSKQQLFQFMNATAGEIQNSTNNQHNANVCLKRWQATLQENQGKLLDGNGFQVTETWSVDQQEIGNWELTIKQGYLLAQMNWVDNQRKEKWDAWRLDQAKWSAATVDQAGKYQWQDVGVEELKSSAMGSQAMLLASLFDLRVLKTLGPTTMDGVDKVADKITCRLRLGSQDSPFYIWLELDDWTQQSHSTLCKSSEDINGRYGLGAVRYDQWETNAAGSWPTHRTLVSGLFEDVVLLIKTQSIQSTEETKSQ